jgi:hypothetical protein
MSLRGALFAASLIVALSLLMPAQLRAAQPFDERDRTIFHLAVNYCRTKPSQKILNAEKNIVCYDGRVDRDEDISPIRDLEKSGLFVVRSTGGNSVIAVKIAKLLGEKHADVVVYDFCASSCANFFLIASDRAYVTRGSIVAWHFPSSKDGKICNEVRPGLDGVRLQAMPCKDAKPRFKDDFAAMERTVQSFLNTRVKTPGSFDFNPPQSTYVRRFLLSKFEDAGVLPSMAWTWNPRYYAPLLKTDIEYEAYPKSQDELDDIAKHFGLKAGSIIVYDP